MLSDAEIANIVTFIEEALEDSSLGEKHTPRGNLSYARLCGPDNDPSPER